MTFAAALFAVASFAQPLARNHQANGQITSPLRYQAQSVPQSWQKTDFLLPNFGKARPMLAPNLQVTDDMQMIVDQPEGTYSKRVGKCCTRLRKCSAKVTFFIRSYKFYLLKLLQNEINVLLLLLL